LKVNLSLKQVNLPDFLVVGAGKSGTTSLHYYLDEHPEIFMPKNKETWFFHLVNNPNKTILKTIPNLPTNFFSYLSLFKDVGNNQICGEITPSYLYYHDLTIKNIKKYHPKWIDLKIIIILREPVDKIKSHYKFVRNLKLDPENLSLKKAILKEPERLASNNVLPDLFYIDNTKYYSQVKAYLDNFSNVKIFLYDDLKNSPKDLAKELFNFLGVDSSFVPKNIGRKYNKSTQVLVIKNKAYKLLIFILKSINYLTLLFSKRIFIWLNKIETFAYKKEEIDPKTLKNLQKTFKNEVLQLEKLLNKDLKHWLKKYD